MNSHGIPSLKELFKGAMIDVDSSPNRHLAQAGLNGRVLHLELLEVPADLEDDEEWEEEESGEEEEEDYDPMGLASDLDDEEDDDEDGSDDAEICNDYPDACPTCEDLECGHSVDDPGDEDLIDVELRVTLLWPAFGGEPQILDDEEIQDNPGLCRFLNQIKDHNDL